MKMRETTKSLRYYFIAAGIFDLLNIGSIFQIQDNLILGILSLIALVFGLLYFYFGIKLNELLYKATQLIINFIIAWMIFSVISQLYGMVITGYNTMFLIFIVISIAIGLYLISNVKRLAKESLNIEK